MTEKKLKEKLGRIESRQRVIQKELEDLNHKRLQVLDELALFQAESKIGRCYHRLTGSSRVYVQVLSVYRDTRTVLLETIVKKKIVQEQLVSLDSFLSDFQCWNHTEINANAYDNIRECAMNRRPK